MLLVVMVFNPLVSTAGSLVLERVTQDSIISKQSVEVIETFQMDMAKCHETSDQRSAISLEELSHATHTNTDSLDCCDDLCMCAEGGCHASLTMNFDANVAYASGGTSASYAGGGYLNPVLNSLTPPPIA